MKTEGTAAVTDAAQHGPATVVVAQPVKRGREPDIRRWQDDVNRAVGEFTGYLGNDIASAAEGDGDQWTVIYRFDSKPHLMSWLTSQEREALLSRGGDLFSGPAYQHVLIRDDEADMVTVVVSHPVDPADEEAFLTWQSRVTDAEKEFPGFRGAELFRPVPGVQDEWTALYRYDTDEHASAWIDSDERKKLLDEGKRFKDFELHRISSPFGSWFAPPDGDEEGRRGPAKWKTAMSVLVGLYPTVVLLTLAISHIWPSASLWQALLLGNICSVSLLTWVVMPVVTRSLRLWLAPRDDGPSVRIDVLGAVASIAFLTFAATIFWLITTQVWHLP